MRCALAPGGVMPADLAERKGPARALRRVVLRDGAIWLES
jgi:hypothetical protein